MSHRRSLFREDAMKRYMQRREKDIFPHLVSPPIFACAWLLFGLLLLAGLVAWWGEIPTFVDGSGILLAQQQPDHPSNEPTLILVFLPSGYFSQMHVGLPVHMQIGSDGIELLGKIEHVEPGIVSPADARKRYTLDSGAAQIITQPSVVVVVKPRKELSVRLYAGSLVRAQIQVGSRRVLSLFPGLDKLIGG
ncbi:MAG TPA: hypothetical protein VFU49_19710 [Ktedonobacteraceae bacterium]|nr:hypothetical protein [Ktedonobacteraceae bacterium]